MSQPQTKPAGDTGALLRRAADHHQRGQLREAEALYREVIAAEPTNFDALHLYGVLKHQRGDPAEALKLIGAALQANARAAPAHANYGIVLAVLERHAEALASYERALALKPDYPEALHNRGEALCKLGRMEEAAESFEAALALRPNDPNTALLLGNCHFALRAYDDALAAYDHALAARADAAEVHNNRGNTLRALGRLNEALASFERAVALKPDDAELYNNRGNALLDLNRAAEALHDYERAVALRGDFADVWVNRGNALHDLSRHDEARLSYERALALDPQFAEAHWNKALLDLTRGDFAQGLPGYEWRRHRAGGECPRDFAKPQWRGEDLRGKTILLHAEQGFGDTIQMLRYIPLVAARGAKVIVEAPDALKPLLASLDGIAMLVSLGEKLPAFDLHCPLMSLPLAFGATVATIPAGVPYLRAPAARIERWRARLPAGPRIGLAWSGKPSHKNDRNRSIPLALLAPILSRPGVTFVSLQREYRGADLPELSRRPNLLRPDDALADFADTAAVVEQLDLVIAVDTAVAHLAGALGKPVFILLPYVPDWRWLFGRADSPWYPTARLFRQPVAGDWNAAIAATTDALTAAL